MNIKLSNEKIAKSAFCIILILLRTLVPGQCDAQRNQSQGWIFLSHTQKINKKFDLLFDAQVRTSDKFVNTNTLLLRSGINYNINEEHAVAIGYAYKGDRERTEPGYDYTNENRIFEQYIYNFKINRSEIMMRGRFEQRWVMEERTRFSQRARIFVSGQIPLLANHDFTKGVYTGIQDEVFLNVTNKENVNDRAFDQNRVFLSLGYRWNRSIDTELGYLNWYQPESETTYMRHVLQLQITTKF